MSWFSGKNKQDRTEEVPVQDKPKTHGMIWLETSSEEVFQKTLDNLLEEVENVSGFVKKSHASNAEIYAQILLKKIKKIDRTKLSSEQRRTLAGIIFASFPRAVAKMETQLCDLSYRDYASEDFGETLRTLMEKYLDSMPRKIPVPNQLNSLSKEKAQQAVETVGNKESDKKLAKMKALAAEAYKLAVTVDDRFFAEQAINSYIPDSVRMLAGLIHAPEDMKVEANELFLRQLEAIETQLNGVIKRSATNSLSEMKAHTEFLESKKERESGLETLGQGDNQ